MRVLTSEDRANADEERTGLRRRELSEVLLTGIGALRKILLGVAGRRGTPAAQVAPRDVHVRVLKADPPRQSLRESMRYVDFTQLHEAGVLDLHLVAVKAVDQLVVVLIFVQRR